jgi:predicted acetyltransferase
VAGGDEAGPGPVPPAPGPPRVVRPVADQELAAYTACIGTAFGRRLSPAWEDRIRLDIGERAIATFEGDRVVGTFGWFPLDLTVPGRMQVPVAYIVAVSVLPTHRRGGLMAAMMRRTFDDLRAAGHPLAVLSASEGGIYGRFGFGAATWRCHYELDKRAARLADKVVPGAGVVRLVDTAEAMVLAPALWERTRRARAGEVSLPPSFWTDHFGLGEPDEEDRRRRFFAVYEEEGSVDGWVDYRVVPEPGGGGRTAVEVRLLLTATREAYASLAAYLLGIDLTTTVRLRHRELDEPLRALLADPRQLRMVAFDDDTWIRPMDVRAALDCRRYAPGPASLSLLVHDPVCAWNEGGYVLDVGPAGAAGVAGPARPLPAVDLELEVGALGSALLGGRRWSSLVREGSVVEHVAGAAWRADAIFAPESQPFATVSL